MSNDRIDSNMEDLVEETAEELAVNAQEYSEEIEKTIANTDGDPCNRLEFLSEYSTYVHNIQQFRMCYPH